MVTLESDIVTVGLFLERFTSVKGNIDAVIAQSPGGVQTPAGVLGVEPGDILIGHLDKHGRLAVIDLIRTTYRAKGGVLD